MDAACPIVHASIAIASRLTIKVRINHLLSQCTCDVQAYCGLLRTFGLFCLACPLFGPDRSITHNDPICNGKMRRSTHLLRRDLQIQYRSTRQGISIVGRPRRCSFFNPRCVATLRSMHMHVNSYPRSSKHQTVVNSILVATTFAFAHTLFPPIAEGAVQSQRSNPVDAATQTRGVRRSADPIEESGTSA